MLLSDFAHQGFECSNFCIQTLIVLGGHVLVRTCEQWTRLIGRALIGLAKGVEHAQCCVDVLIRTQGKCVEADAFHIEQLIDQYIANRTQFVFKI